MTSQQSSDPHADLRKLEAEFTRATIKHTNHVRTVLVAMQGALLGQDSAAIARCITASQVLRRMFRLLVVTDALDVTVTPKGSIWDKFVPALTDLRAVKGGAGGAQRAGVLRQLWMTQQYAEWVDVLVGWLWATPVLATTQPESSSSSSSAHRTTRGTATDQHSLVASAACCSLAQQQVQLDDGVETTTLSALQQCALDTLLEAVQWESEQHPQAGLSRGTYARLSRVALWNMRAESLSASALEADDWTGRYHVLCVAGGKSRALSELASEQRSSLPAWMHKFLGMLRAHPDLKHNFLWHLAQVLASQTPGPADYVDPTRTAFHSQPRARSTQDKKERSRSTSEQPCLVCAVRTARGPYFGSQPVYTAVPQGVLEQAGKFLSAPSTDRCLCTHSSRSVFQRALFATDLLWNGAWALLALAESGSLVAPMAPGARWVQRASTTTTATAHTSTPLYAGEHKKARRHASRMDTSAQRKLATACWMALLSHRRLPVNLYKRVLTDLRTLVVPFINNAAQLSDFCTDSYNLGGVVSLLALESLFHLMFVYSSGPRLNYPDFYPKLYRVCTPSVCHAKHRGKFLTLVGQVLTSQYIPNYMAAAFAKRLARLALGASPDVALYLLGLVHSLLRRHPSVRVLIHRQASAHIDTSNINNNNDGSNSSSSDAEQAAGVMEDAVEAGSEGPGQDVSQGVEAVLGSALHRRNLKTAGGRRRCSVTPVLPRGVFEAPVKADSDGGSEGGDGLLLLNGSGEQGGADSGSEGERKGPGGSGRRKRARTRSSSKRAGDRSTGGDNAAGQGQQEAAVSPFSSAIGADPFRWLEMDPAQSRALMSSLWEVRQMTGHYLNSVKRLAQSFWEGNAFEKAVDLQALLRTGTYETLFEKEASWRKNQPTPLNIQAPVALFDPTDSFRYGWR